MRGVSPYIPVAAEQAGAFLAQRFGDAVTDVEPIGHGEWSKAFAFRRSTAAYVIRFSEIDEDFAKDERATRLEHAGLPIPKMVERGRALEGHYAITERAPGGYLDDLDENQMRRVLPSLFAGLDAMRVVDVSSTTGYGLWGADGHGRHPSWNAALLAIAEDLPGTRTHGAVPERMRAFEAGLKTLESLVVSCPESRHLVHSDLLHFNVLVDEGRVSAVLDWGSSLYGDFLYDIAWFAFWAPWFPAWNGIDFVRESATRYAANNADVPGFAERLRCYQVHIGLDGQAYNAFRGRWDHVDAIARRTLEVAAQG